MTATLPPQLEVRPARRIGTRVGALIALVITASMAWSVARNPAMQWDVVGKYLLAPITLQGVVVTLYLTAMSTIIGLFGGILVAVMRLSRSAVLRAIAAGYIALFRSVPPLVQILFWGYLGALYPQVGIFIPFTEHAIVAWPTNAVIGATTAAVLALGLNEVAYAAEIIRGGVIAVDRGQTEAARSLGMTPRLTLIRIVLPQALRGVVPALGNEIITLLKMTSLVSVIAGADLLTRLQNVYAQTYEIIPLLTVASIWYIVLTIALTIPQHYVEKHLGRGHADWSMR